MKNKLLSILLLGLLATCLAGCGEVNYTENMIRVREKYNPWYLSSKLKAGEIYDNALKNADWKDNGDTVIVSGIDKVKVNLANCCNPVFGDDIIGYITKGSGITVHRSNCKNIIDLDERLINVKWNDAVTKKFSTDLLVYADPTDNLLDIITVAGANNISIESVYTITKSEFKIYSLTVLTENTDKLNKFINNLNNLKFIKSVERQMN